MQRVYARVMKWLSRRGLLRGADEADASNAPPSQSPAEALASAGMQRGTLLTVRESGDGSSQDDAGLAPPPPPRVTDAVTHERFNLLSGVLDASKTKRVLDPEAMWLIGVLRTAGVEPAAGGLLITPRGAPGHDTYTVDVPLLRIDVAPGSVHGVYRPKNDGALSLTVALDRSHVTAKVRGANVTAPASGGRVVLPLVFHAGEEIAFEVVGQ